MMWPPPAPMTRARSTNTRSLSDSTWLRMIRAVAAQLVRPMTTMMTIRVARIPRISASEPDDVQDDRGQDQREDERRQDEEEVRDPHQDACRSCHRRSPRRSRSTAPTTIVTIVASRPIVIEMRAPWTVRLSMSRPRSSVPKMCAATAARGAAGGRRGRLERPDEQAGNQRQHREHDEDDAARPRRRRGVRESGGRTSAGPARPEAPALGPQRRRARDARGASRAHPRIEVRRTRCRR